MAWPWPKARPGPNGSWGVDQGQAIIYILYIYIYIYIKPRVASSRIDLFGGSAQNGSAQNGSAGQPLVHRVLREVLPLLAVDSDCKIPSVEPLFILNLALIC